MDELLLDSLEIQNFRMFRRLQIEKLGRVNLIVGKNNVGKTALLEALHLYVSRGFPAQMWLDLAERGVRPDHNEVDGDNLLEAVRYLFYGMQEIKGNSPSIRIGPKNVQEKTLAVSLGWFVREIKSSSGDLVQLRLLQPEEYLLAEDPVPRWNIEFEQHRFDYSLRTLQRTPDMKIQQEPKNVFIRANGLNNNQAILLWDNVALTDLEEEVINALRIIAPGVKDFTFRGYSMNTSPVPLVRVEDREEPLALSHLGTGMLRLLGIILALVNAKDGVLLIDEIENGIHYSAQQEIWQMIFRLANHLNVQVFATTHSWDCIKAFQHATSNEKQKEGLLIRLSLKKGEVEATLFDEEELQIATREGLEVR